MAEQNPDRLFWRCSQPQTQQYAFFMWPISLKFRITRKSTSARGFTVGSLSAQESDSGCNHRAGTCKDCGNLASYTKKAMNRRSTSPSRSSGHRNQSFQQCPHKGPEQWQLPQRRRGVPRVLRPGKHINVRARIESRP